MHPGGGSGSQSGGMNPEGNPSGSVPQQPMNLDDRIRQLLQVHGNSEPHPQIRRRKLRNQEEPMQIIDTVEKQYDNLVFAYNELNNEFQTSSTRVQNIPMVRLHYLVITILCIYNLFLLGMINEGKNGNTGLGNFKRSTLLSIKKLFSFFRVIMRWNNELMPKQII
uniref:Uncharacterized protein n=2 Tax=Meloidogyne enterolobii TaxID=390850 RepID=A0A6V7WNH4_MELEN|nr:unnamed protein product [Meloidogyne enterolobii]